MRLGVLWLAAALMVLGALLAPVSEAAGPRLTIYVYGDGSLRIESSGRLRIPGTPHNYTTATVLVDYNDGMFSMFLREQSRMTWPLVPPSRLQEAGTLTKEVSYTWSCVFDFRSFSDGKTLLMWANQYLYTESGSKRYVEHRSAKIVVDRGSLEAHVELNMSLSLRGLGYQRILWRWQSHAQWLNQSFPWFRLLDSSYEFNLSTTRLVENLSIEYTVNLGQTTAALIFLIPAGIDEPDMLFARGTASVEGDFWGMIEDYLTTGRAGTYIKQSYISRAELSVEARYQVLPSLYTLTKLAGYLTGYIALPYREPVLGEIIYATPAWMWVDLWGLPRPTPYTVHIREISRLSSRIELANSKGLLEIIVDRDGISYNFTSPRFRFRSVDGPEAALRLAEELWPDILGMLKVMLGVEIDMETIGRRVENLPVTLIPGDDRVAGITPAETTVNNLATVNVALKNQAAESPKHPLETVLQHPPTQAPSRNLLQHPLVYLGIGFAMGILVGLATRLPRRS